MAIEVGCPNCGKKLKAPDSLAGRVGKCPACGTRVQLPDAPEPPEVMEPEVVDDDSLGALADAAGHEEHASYELAQPPDAPEEGDRRPCPMCGEMIATAAVKCRFCGEVFDPKLKKAMAPRRGDVPSYLGQSILVTLCCCLPLGIPAIVYSAQVSSKLAAGDYKGAVAASNNAKMWGWIAFGVGLAVNVIAALGQLAAEGQF